MAFYSYKRVRELIPQHLADKYQAEWKGEHDSEYGKQQRIKQLVDMGNSIERAIEIWSQDEWHWDNSYNGDLFDAAADTIESLRQQLEEAQKYRQALQNIVDGNYPSADRRSKCAHDKYHWEECTNCIDDYIESVLSAAPMRKEAEDK